MTITIDLTKEDVSCVEHPIVKLVRTLSDLNESEVIVIVSKDDIPSGKILEMIADKIGYKIIEMTENEKTIKAKFIRI
ncbi:MAG: hypothetical protein QW101_02095 [Ignisphaera sp.]|uniref:Sulfurtransferase TusA family protein n=1 Tax=Ignisphaera aggregans TaxID=334771 RepID=A0A7J3MYT7_9CREN